MLLSKVFGLRLALDSGLPHRCRQGVGCCGAPGAVECVLGAAALMCVWVDPTLVTRCAVR